LLFVAAVVGVANGFSSVDGRVKRSDGKSAGQNCQATTAFDATTMGLNVTLLEANGIYTCENTTFVTNETTNAYEYHWICWTSNAVPDTGDTAWMLFSTTFVMLQTPAAGFAQAGLVRRKNAMSVIGQAYLGVVIGSIIWWIWGYSLTFGPGEGDEGDGSFIGHPSTYAFFKDVSAYDCADGTIPHLLFCLFQMTFSLMVPVLITGAWAEKFHLSSAVLFMIIWPHLVYYPTAHWIWGGGWLSKQNAVGVLDYAGGIVIHTSSGVSSFVVAMMLQKRRAFSKKVDDTTHNLPLSMIGVALVWVGWYCFNGGSGLRANGQAVSALAVTQLSACFGACTFSLFSYLEDGHVQVTHIASGALAGLAGITPCSGFVEVWAGCPIGIMVALSSWFGAKLVKSVVNLDDVLDVTSLQAFPGAVGSILVGFFATNDVLPCAEPDWPGKECGRNPNTDYGVFYGGDGELLGWQIFAVLLQIVWSGFFTWVTMMMIKYIRGMCGQGYGFDVSPEMEELGLDKTSHGEKAYDIEARDDEQEDSVKVAKLNEAAATGDIDLCRSLVQAGTNPSKGDVDGRTALHIAAGKGQLEIVKMFVVEMNVDKDSMDKWSNTPLREAVRGQHGMCIDWLKKQGATTNLTEGDHKDFLNAAANGDSSKVESLLFGGMNPNDADYDGRTALHLAAAGGDTTTVQVLLRGGASHTEEDRFGGLAVQDAQRSHHDAIVKIITDFAAGTNEPFTADVLRPVSAKEGTKTAASASVRELLDAAKGGQVSEFKRLRAKQVKLGLADYDGRTALHVAAELGHLDAVKYLASSKGVNINAQDNLHMTPLMGAAKEGKADVVAFLKGLGASITSDSVGTMLCEAAAKGDQEALKNQFAQGVDPNTADYDGRTAMHLAAATGNASIIQFLASSNANVNCADRWGGSPLGDAVRSNHSYAKDTLLGLGAKDHSSRESVSEVSISQVSVL
jgi:Amt family ammonium transporter